MSNETSPSLGRLIGIVAIFVVLGTPMVAYLWWTLNNVLAGHVEWLGVIIALVVLGLFALLLRVLSGAIHRVEGHRDALPGARPPMTTPDRRNPS